jgi:5-methylcytosine-specific restriction enzyme subunit McrC
LQFRVDLVLYDARSDETICVLDTKYKTHDEPSPDDVAQVVAYAEAKGCREAVLVYPRKLKYPFEAAVGRIRVRGLAFSLDGDLEMAGEQFLASLFMEGEEHGKR